MLKYAEVLAKDFPFVRLDFYEIAGKIYLGEFTFTPFGNNLYPYYYKENLVKFGNILELPCAQNDFIE